MARTRLEDPRGNEDSLAIISAFSIACMGLRRPQIAQSKMLSPPRCRPDYKVAVMQALDKDQVQIRSDRSRLSITTACFLSETLRERPDQHRLRARIGTIPFCAGARQADGEITYLRAFLLRATVNRMPRKAGETRLLADASIVAGEECQWRETVSRLSGSFLSRERTCVTGDGIAVETKLLGAKDLLIYHTRLTPASNAARLPPTEMLPPPEI